MAPKRFDDPLFPAAFPPRPSIGKPSPVVAFGGSAGVAGLSVFAPPRLPKLKPPAGAFGGSVSAGVATLSAAAAGVEVLPRVPKLNPPAGGLGGVAGLSVFAAPKLPKLNPPDGGAEAADGFGASSGVSAGF